MRSSKIVFNQPLGDILIKLFNIRIKVSKSDEFVLKSLIETLVNRIVFGSSGATPVMRQLQLVASSFKIFMEFRSVIGLDVFNVSINQVKKPIEKISGIFGTGSFVHSSKSYLRKEIDAGKDIALEPAPLEMDGVQAQQEAAFGSFLKFGNSDLFLGSQAFSGDSNGSSAIWIELVFLDNPLNFPTGNPFAIILKIYLFQLKLGIAKISFSEFDDSAFLQLRDFRLPGILRRSASVL